MFNEARASPEERSRPWCRRFAHCDNDADQQHVRMQDLLACASRDYLSGTGLGGLEFWDVVQATSKIRKGGAATVDGNSSDIFWEFLGAK